MKTDLVIAPFNADLADMVGAGQAAAEGGGFDTVWTYDHFSGLVTGANWSRDPFVTLGAIAATTAHINVGVLVANANNRHPAQLACAVNSLQSLAPGRVILGLGAGTSAKSRWSAEQAAIGRPAAVAATRRAYSSNVGALRAIWAGEPFDASTDGRSVDGLVDDTAIRRSSSARAALAPRRSPAPSRGGQSAPGDDLAERIALARSQTPPWFEISVFTALDIDTRSAVTRASRRARHRTPHALRRGALPTPAIAAIAGELAGST